MPPVVVNNFAVIFLDRKEPAAEDDILDVEPLDKIQVEEHSQTRLQYTYHYHDQSHYCHQPLGHSAQADAHLKCILIRHVMVIKIKGV